MTLPAITADPPILLPAYTRRAAVALTAVWLIACGVLYGRFIASEATPSWDKALVLYNGLCAVGFTAVGVLLGTQVQEVNVVAARRDAQAAQRDKAVAQTDAATVRAGARAALRATTAGDDRGGGEAADPAARARLDAVRSQLIDIL